MEKKWNLQDIKPVSSNRPTRPERSNTMGDSQMPPRREEHTEDSEDTFDDSDIERVSIIDGKKRGRGKVWLVVIILLVLVSFAFVASYIMRGAVVTVYPQVFETNLNADFTAYKAAPANELSYEIMTLEASGEKQVKASGKQQVTEQATGRIRIYKSTPGTQRLIKNTRFSDASGKIFRISESVVVPGAVDGKPGNIEAEVFADEPGEGYNLPAKTKFTVPGLESDPALYNAIYAENTDALTGGFSGEKFIIDNEQLATAQQALQMELRDTLTERITKEKPANMTAFLSSVSFTYESLPAVAYGDDLATIKEKAILYIPLFKNDDFASYLARATLSSYNGSSVRLENPEAITFTYESATTSNENLANLDQLEFTLAGKPILVYTYDEGLLTTDLLGANKNALSTVLSKYPSIKKAEVTVKPFWKRTFPTNINEIEIIEVVNTNN